MQGTRAPHHHPLTLKPAIVVACAFEAGLATGLAHFPAPYPAILILAGSALMVDGARRWIPAVAAVGLALGLSARKGAESGCAARLREGIHALTVQLAEPVRSGIADARLEGCRGPIRVRVRGERLLAAGSWWRVEGRWIPWRRFGGGPDGLFVAQSTTGLPARKGARVGDRLRNRIAEATAALYGARAGLVDALLVGSRGGIDPSLNAAFARSGLVHLLSISGFHVGVVFAWTTLLLRGLRARPVVASAVAAALVVLYVAFLGWPPPAARAALLAVVVASTRSRQRNPDAWSLLAVTALLVTLLDPWAVFDLGAWLSLTSLWGALKFTRWSDRAIGTGVGWRMLFASLGATLATAPLTAAALGAVAPAGILLNFAAIPLAALAVPAVLLSVVVHPISSLISGALAAGGGLGLAGLEELARWGSRLPGGALVGTPSPLFALPWLIVLAAALWMVGRRNTSRRALLRAGWGLATAGLIALLPAGRLFATRLAPGLSLHFLSVGQGDAAVIRTPGGHWIVVDAGPAGGGRDAGREVVLPFLVRHGARRLSAFVLSHAHLDHAGGAPSLLRALPADQVLEPAEPVAEPSYLDLLDLLSERGIRWIPARRGDSLLIDGVKLKILHPDTTWAGWRADLNDDSVVLLVQQGDFQALLGGDLGVKAESLLAGKVGRVDLLKVGHHGSSGSSGAPWLAELGPRAAVISVGPNRYGHPSPLALERLEAAGVELWRTDREGSIAVSVGESTMTVRGRHRTRVYPIRP